MINNGRCYFKETGQKDVGDVIHLIPTVCNKNSNIFWSVSACPGSVLYTLGLALNVAFLNVHVPLAIKAFRTLGPCSFWAVWQGTNSVFHTIHPWFGRASWRSRAGAGLFLFKWRYS